MTVAWTQNKAAPVAKLSTHAPKDSLMNLDTLNILGDDAYTPFIWNQDDGELDSIQIRQQIEKRDFAHEEFFMRNIDREELEEEKALLQFLGQDQSANRRKKAVWTPFPDPAGAKAADLGPKPTTSPSPQP